MTEPLFTVGHSDRTIDEFTGLLRDAGIARLVDVRKLPGSRAFPHFNADALAASLADIGIDYLHVPALTGRRPVSKEVPFEVNGFWTNRSFHNYADHALSEEFRSVLTELRADAAPERTVLMCSEAVWWRCHRRIIADHLLAHGDEVFHIMSAKGPSGAELTKGAVVHDDATVTYPAT